jgi:hypothetical protein
VTESDVDVRPAPYGKRRAAFHSFELSGQCGRFFSQRSRNVLALGTIIELSKDTPLSRLPSQMTTPDSYRNIAMELKAKAEKERSQAASELENLALCYLRLTEQAGTNPLLHDIAAKLGPKNRLGEGEGRN